jgi:hypothetical protein
VTAPRSLRDGRTREQRRTDTVIGCLSVAAVFAVLFLALVIGAGR